jgi:hypothetical protein
MVLLGAALAACAHVPPDAEARAVAPPPVVRTVPPADALTGAWKSVSVRGALADLGQHLLYAFDGAGRFTGALVDGATIIPVGGKYAYDETSGALTLEDGALLFEVVRAGETLELRSDDSFLVLARLGGTLPPR